MPILQKPKFDASVMAYAATMVILFKAQYFSAVTVSCILLLVPILRKPGIKIKGFRHQTRQYSRHYVPSGNRWRGQIPFECIVDLFLCIRYFDL
jgi:hypothetical protein